MKASQYKAIRDTGVEEFAIAPIDIEGKLPYTIEFANKQSSVRACPAGLTKAKILDDDVEWSETFTLGCGDTEYQRKRRNGVLVEVSLEAVKESGWALTRIKKAPRTKVVTRNGNRVVEMIVSKLAIMAPWNEYTLIEAEREKACEEERERMERLQAAVSGIGGASGRFTEERGEYDDDTHEYLPPKDYDYTVTYEHSDRRPVYLKGEVVLSLTLAEKIAKLLAAKR